MPSSRTSLAGVVRARKQVFPASLFVAMAVAQREN
jgi:hypothetical protein